MQTEGNTKAPQLMRIVAFLLLLIVLSPMLSWYFSGIGWTALWIYAWLAVWFIFVKFDKWDAATRGIFLIVLSSWIAIVGRVYLTVKGEDNTVVEGLSNMMLLIAGGVGGNFITAYLQKK